MRRKRRRSRLNPTPILWLLLAANVIAGMLYSPLTTVRSVRVDGAPAWDFDRLRTVAEKMKGIPCAQINPRTIESQAMAIPDVRSARLSRNLFGSAVLTVGYRTPIARIEGQKGMVLSIEGVIYHSNAVVSDLPSVKLGPQTSNPLFTIATDWPAADIANLVIKAKRIDPNAPIKIEFDAGNSLCLNMGTGRVVLGSSDDLDEKLQVLTQRLAADPNLLSKIQTLILTVAGNPQIVPNPGVKN
ncbi:MAG TPA: hypothetical protein VG944_07435 [Fimbriimonas sp.]|nr:hypothetical protein [Fimbriimonas sp.]